MPHPSSVPTIMQLPHGCLSGNHFECFWSSSSQPWEAKVGQGESCRYSTWRYLAADTHHAGKTIAYSKQFTCKLPPRRAMALQWKYCSRELSLSMLYKYTRPTGCFWMKITAYITVVAVREYPYTYTLKIKFCTHPSSAILCSAQTLADTPPNRFCSKWEWVSYLRVTILQIVFQSQLLIKKVIIFK